MIVTTRPRTVEAYQYDGVYVGAVLREIKAALIRWFGIDGDEDEDDARSFFGVTMMGQGRCEPRVHLSPAPEVDGGPDVPLPPGSWVVYDPALCVLSVHTDEEFHALYEVSR